MLYNLSRKVAGLVLLMLCSMFCLVMAQNTVQISGNVTDAFGEPLVGVNIVQQGTTNGTVTDLDGNFVLGVPQGADLTVSYIGYVSQTVKAQPVMKIKLVEDNEALEEVVVIGYGVVKKSDLAGAVSTVSSKAFKDQPVTRVEDTMQGRLAGVSVSNMSGAPGSSIKIRVRGANSINKSNDPLYVIDGIVGDINGLNTADIQSIEVLKDASSTAIYGSRGANGVVIITTRRGEAGTAKVTLDTEIGVQTISKRYDLLDAEEYARAYNEIRGSQVIDPALFANGGGTDWQDEIFQTGLSQNYKVSISGGNNQTQYFVSGNILDQSGIVITSGYKRYAFRTNVASKVTDWLDVTADVRLSNNKGKNNNISSGKGNPLWTAITYTPSMSIYDADGNYNKDQYNSLAENPVGLLKDSRDEYMVNKVNGMLDLRFKLAKGLTFTATGGVDYTDRKDYSFDSNKVFTSNGTGTADAYTMNLQSTNNLTYTGNWNGHSLIATGVFEYSSNQVRNMDIHGTGLLTESVGYWNVNVASSTSNSNSYSEYSLLSYVGRLMYGFKNRYNATLTFRADGSSKFTEEKWGYFPSAALAWNIAEEGFMKNQNIFQNLKLRASYGIIGNQAIQAYETLGLLTSTLYDYGTGSRFTGYWGATFATPDLTWEKTYQFDLGLDISVLNNRLNFTIDYYDKKTKDALLQKTIPQYNGGGSFWVNRGEIANRGIELAIDAYPVRTDDFTWNSNFNFTWSKNEVKDLAGDAYILGSSPANGLVGSTNIVKPGEPIGAIYGIEWEGLDAKGNNVYKDVNGDGAISSDDFGVIGKSTPDITLGWNNIFTYKNWEFSFLMTGSFGADKLNLTRFTIASQVGDSRFITLRDAYYQGFDKIGANAEYASLTSQNNVHYGNSSQWLESADFVRLKNLSIAYNMPKSLTRFADVRLSVSCQNLFTITGYSGMDPETFSENSDVVGGMDVGAYPIPRTITFGARFTF